MLSDLDLHKEDCLLARVSQSYCSLYVALVKMVSASSNKIEEIYQHYSERKRHGNHCTYCVSWAQLWGFEPQKPSQLRLWLMMNVCKLLIFFTRLIFFIIILRLKGYLRRDNNTAGINFLRKELRTSQLYINNRLQYNYGCSARLGKKQPIFFFAKVQSMTIPKFVQISSVVQPECVTGTKSYFRILYLYIYYQYGYI